MRAALANQQGFLVETLKAKSKSISDLMTLIENSGVFVYFVQCFSTLKFAVILRLSGFPFSRMLSSLDFVYLLY